MTTPRTISGGTPRDQGAFRLHPGRHLIAELLHAHAALLRLFSREVGITPSRVKFLYELLHTGREGVGLSDLALRLAVTPALVTRQVKELEKEGLIRRRRDPRDGRRIAVQLTPRGIAVITAMHERMHRFEAAVKGDMHPDDVAAAIRVLADLGERLESRRRTGRRILDADPVNNTAGHSGTKTDAW